MNARTFRRIIAAFLALVFAAAFAGCGQSAPPDQSVSQSETSDGAPGASENSAETAPANHPETGPVKNYLRDPLIALQYQMPPLCGSDVSILEIKSITFLDTLENMPDDAWDLGTKQGGPVKGWVLNGCDLYIAGEGGVAATSCKGLFSNYENVETIRFNGCFDTSETTDMRDMFGVCMKLREVDTQSLNTQNVTAADCMFYYCTSLTAVDLSGWDLSNLQSAANMFYMAEALTDIGCTLDLPADCDVESMYDDSGLR